MLLLTLITGCSIYPKVNNFIEERPVNIGLQRRVVNVSNGQVAYWEGGNPDGEAILWIHGFGGDSMWAWVRNIPAFTEDYRIIAPDLLWFGDSYGGVNLDSQVDAMLTVLEAEGVERTHVVALSYGGFVGLKMMPSDVVESLVLVGVGGADWGTEEISRLQEQFDVESLSDLFVPKDPEDVRTLVDVCFHLPTVLMPSDFDSHLYGKVFGKHPEKQRELIDDLLLQANDISTWTPTVLPPTLLIVGRQDPIFSIQDVDDLRVTLNAEMKSYGLADHVPQVGYKSKFNRDVKRFLSQYAAAPSLESSEFE